MALARAEEKHLPPPVSHLSLSLSLSLTHTLTHTHIRSLCPPMSTTIISLSFHLLSFSICISWASCLLLLIISIISVPISNYCLFPLSSSVYSLCFCLSSFLYPTLFPSLSLPFFALLVSSCKKKFSFSHVRSCYSIPRLFCFSF